ncbi:DUF2336 domain-containing protein [Methylobacterium sp. Leaf118]|uniref:DUF2336 domain-containing protein n=1 Tax=Methylobacterium sp. Leaf118 TaxID=2876562 RepID=UPI001E3D11BD|nr:DUF2336 domain-containing protein [Methylobacterium sp. Leaf118]
MILRQFLTLTQHASVERRAEAAGALTRAYLDGSLGPDAAWEAKTALLALLDDPDLAVRRAMAEAAADSDVAPRPLVVALASDHPNIACLVLARSPVLMDADLVDCAAVGCEGVRAAVASRGDLSKPVAAALAEVAGVPSLTALAKNPRAAIGTAAFLRMVERHGTDADLRQALLARHDLSIEARHALVTLAAEQLSQLGQDSGWISSARGARVAREAREAAALALSDEAGETGLARLVAHLRVQEQLTAGLILRAILSLRLPFAEVALAELSGLSRARVAGLMFEPRGAGFCALHRRAGLPALLLPAIQAALAVWGESAHGRNGMSGPRLARSMIEAALTACETMPFAEARGLLALLARFEAEAARDEARLFAQAQIEAHARDEAARQLALPQAEFVDAAMAEDAAGRPLPDVIILSGPDGEGSVDGAGREVAEEKAVPALPDAAAAWPLAPRPQDRIGAPVAAMASAAPEVRVVHEATEAVLAGLSDALMASFLAARTEPAAPAPEVRPERRISARPHVIAAAVAAAMMPDHLIVRPRDERAPQSLAA